MSKQSKRKERVIGGIRNLLSKTKDELKTGSKEFRSEFKELLHTAQHAAKTAAKKAGHSRNKVPPDYSHINYNAGGKILAHFQEQWAEMHETTTENSVLATSLDRKLQELAKVCKDRHKAVEDFHKEFQGLPIILKGVEQAKNAVEEIGASIEKVEQSLKEFEYSCSLLDNARKKGVMRVRYEAVIQEKEEEVAKLQKRIDAEKEAIKQKNEEINQNSLRERQQAFDDIFKQQVTEYKSKGHVERPISLGSDTIVYERLGDIEIDDVDGKQSLSDFLDDIGSGEDDEMSDNVLQDQATVNEIPQDSVTAEND
ncbi:dysbindin protein homolog [Dysidea avara]|uniref:dysbindin protein homolog n=1 Tax=Dysidea avara TaxID=196820 RepID=UPI00332D0780